MEDLRLVRADRVVLPVQLEQVAEGHLPVLRREGLQHQTQLVHDILDGGCHLDRGLLEHMDQQVRVRRSLVLVVVPLSVPGLHILRHHIYDVVLEFRAVHVCFTEQCLDDIRLEQEPQQLAELLVVHPVRLGEEQCCLDAR